jgi:hypothetical protein
MSSPKSTKLILLRMVYRKAILSYGLHRALSGDLQHDPKYIYQYQKDGFDFPCIREQFEPTGYYNTCKNFSIKHVAAQGARHYSNLELPIVPIPIRSNAH